MAEEAANCWFSSSTTIPNTPISSTRTSSSTGPSATPRTVTRPSTGSTSGRRRPSSSSTRTAKRSIGSSATARRPTRSWRRSRSRVAGIDTYGALSDRYAKDPDNVEVVFKLAEKCADRYSDELTKRVQRALPEGPDHGPRRPDRVLLRRVPQGDRPLRRGRRVRPGADRPPAAASPTRRPSGRSSPSTRRASSSRTPTAACRYYYGYQATKEDAAKFFDEALAKFPDDKNMVSTYIERIVRDKEPVDKGIALAEKLKEKIGYPRDPDIQENLAQLYALKDDPAKVEEEYGKDFIEGYVTNGRLRPDGLRELLDRAGQEPRKRRGDGRHRRRRRRGREGRARPTISPRSRRSTPSSTRSTRPWPSTAPSRPRRAGTTEALSTATPRSGTARTRTSTAPSRPPRGPSS